MTWIFFSFLHTVKERLKWTTVKRALDINTLIQLSEKSESLITS